MGYDKNVRRHNTSKKWKKFLKTINQPWNFGMTSLLFPCIITWISYPYSKLFVAQLVREKKVLKDLAFSVKLQYTQSFKVYFKWSISNSFKRNAFHTWAQKECFNVWSVKYVLSHLKKNTCLKALKNFKKEIVEIKH